MSSNEGDRVSRFKNLMARGNNMAKKLIWDPVAKRIRPLGHNETNPSGFLITPDDMKHSGV